MVQKFTRMHIFCFVLALFQFVYPSIKNDILPPPTKRGTEIIKTLLDKEKTLSKKEQSDLIIELQNEKTRAIQASALDSDSKLIKYGPNAFAAADAFYLCATGASDTPDANDLAKVKDKTLVRASIVNTSGAPVVQFSPMAGDKVNVNGAFDGDTKKIEVSPLQGLELNPITVADGVFPVVGVNGIDFSQVYLVEDRFNGTLVRNNNTDGILDADGGETKIANLAASKDTIFAAVSPLANDFGVENSGIVRLQRQPLDEKGFGELRVVNPVDGTFAETADAYQINLNAHNVSGSYVESNTDVKFAFSPDAGATGITSADDLGKVVDMHWDQDLGRLYIGLTGAKGFDNSGNNSGGVVSVLVGRIDSDKKMYVKPIIDLQAAGKTPLLPVDSEKHIIGFNAADATLHTASAIKIRTMHTSTGKDYVIINGGVAASGAETALNTQVYALPVVRTDEKDSKNIGFLAKNYVDTTNKTTSTDPFVIVTVATDLLTRDDLPTNVGQGAGLPSANTEAPVTDMRIVGDTIYISTAGDRTDNNKNAGIFSSTALFDQNGVIRSWTPWQRVMGSTDMVRGFGLDNTSGNFWYLSQDAKVKGFNTAKVTQWGRSEAVGGNNVSSYLATKFPQSKAGVHHVFSYGEKTPGFKEDEFAMDVAVGLETVAMFQTGTKEPAATSNVLGLVQDPLTDANVFNFNDDVIKALGPITSTELAKNTTANQGWFFVGGYNGVGVLSKADGSGFDSSAPGLTELSSTAGKFPGDEFAFRKLVTKDPVDFSRVRKLQSDGTSLYVMTRDKLYKFGMDEDFFKAASPTAITADITLEVAGAKLSDFVVAGGKIMLATTAGLYLSTDGKSASKVANTPDSPIVQLQYLSEDRSKPSSTGNLYVLAADMSKSSATLHRFDVNMNAKIPTPIITPIVNPDLDTTTGQIINFNEFKGNAVTDGSFIFSQLSKHFGQADFVNLNAVDNLETTYQITPQLDLDDRKYNVGMMVRDEASGAWIVPLDNGIRVNQ